VKLKPLFGLALTLLVAACAQTQKIEPVITPKVTPVSPAQETGKPVAVESEAPNSVPEALRLSNLPGWTAADPFIALEALRSACAYKKGRQYGPVCQAMASQDFETTDQIKGFLLSHLQIEPIAGQGLMTGYFVPDYEASYKAEGEFSQGVRTKPDDLIYVSGSQMTPRQSSAHVAARKVGDTYLAYPVRAEIEKSAVSAAYYMRPEDYFFMQLQGSGFLDLPDGKRVYAAYAADNGQPFVGIAKVMVAKGYLAQNQTSGDNIHQWLADHRGPEATSVMNANPRYGFFAIQPDQNQPLGAAAVPLPPGSAIAVDSAYHDLGDLFWLDADAGTLKDAFPAYQRMVAALDTGGAIRGNVRADLYVGHGTRAGVEAGRIKHDLRLWRIMPFVGEN